MLYAMEPAESDWYTIYGFVFSVAGVVVSVVGLSATLWEVVKARRSVDKAEQAVNLSIKQSKANFRQYLAATIHRQLSEVEGFVFDESWLVARLRCDDMAGILAQLPEPVMAGDHRVFGVFFSSKQVNLRLKFDRQKWDELVLRTKTRIDALTAPFNNAGDM